MARTTLTGEGAPQVIHATHPFTWVNLSNGFKILVSLYTYLFAYLLLYSILAPLISRVKEGARLKRGGNERLEREKSRE